MELVGIIKKFHADYQVKTDQKLKVVLTFFYNKKLLNFILSFFYNV